MLSIYASNIINPLCEDLEKKLKLYSNSLKNKSLDYSFEHERYIKIAEIIVNQNNLDIEEMINNLPDYYKNGISYKDSKFDIRNEASQICSQIYKQLYYIDEKSAFKKYLHILQNKLVGDLNWFFELFFDNDSIKEHFLNKATQYIIEHQNSSWIDEFKKVDYQKYSWFKFIEIDKIPKDFNTSEDVYFWLIENEQIEILNFLGSALLNSLLRVVIQYDSYNIHSHNFNKNRIVQILEECKNDYILIGKILTSQDIRLNIFFLHFFDYSLFGFLNLYELDSAPHYLESKKINYTQEWNEHIAKQLNDIFFLHFSSMQNKDNFSAIIFNIINYMAKEYVSNFSNNDVTHQKRKEVFQYFLESVSTCELITGQYEKTLLIEYCIKDLINKQVKRLDTNQLDLASYYLLVFYTKQIVRIEKLFDKVHNDLIAVIINSLIENLKTIFTNNLQDDRLYFKVDFLKTIDFSFLYEVSRDKKQWYSLMNIYKVKSRWLEVKEKKSIQKSHSSQDPIEPKNIVKLYFYILMKIYQNHQEEEIASLLNQLAIEFGLKIDFGIFYEIFWMEHQFTENLFIEYIKLLNTVNDDLFNSFLEYLVEKEQLRDLLELLNYTEIEARKPIVQSKINDIYKNVDFESLSYYDIRESILYAQYNDFNDLATKFLNLYQEKISKNKNQNKYKEKEFLEIVCKKELLDIVNDNDLLLDDKLIKLNTYKNPFDDRNYGVESKQIKCKNYKDFIRAILFFETKPLHTYKILSELVEKELNSLYLINMLNAYFRAYEEDEHKKVKYEYILEKYEEYDKRFVDREKSLYEYQTLVYGYSKIENTDMIDKIYKEIPTSSYKKDITNYLPEKLELFGKSIAIKNKLLICVEGEFDIKFLKNINKAIDEYKNIIDLEESKISLIPLGGSNLKKWVKEHHLYGSNIIELHIYDSDIGASAKNENKYSKECQAVNNRQDSSYCFLTKKREMENYIHKSIIEEEFDIDMSYIEDWNQEDIPTYIINKINKNPIKNENAIKEILNGKLVSKMTKELLEDIEAFEEIKGWFEKIRELSEL
jgi:hypothetical protein